MDPHPATRQLRIASQRFQYEIEKIPSPGGLAAFHSAFKELSENNFHIPQKPWLKPFELAYVTNYTCMFGTNKRKQKPIFTIDPSLNALKKLWKLAEEECAYSDQPDNIATFMLRIVYQQIPYIIHTDRVLPMLSRMSSLMSSKDMAGWMLNRYGVNDKDFFDAMRILFQNFTKNPICRITGFSKVISEEVLSKSLTLISATQQQRILFHRNKLELKSPVEKPYEINSLLRYPIIKSGDELYCPYPQLIGYAGTKGLFFRFSEEAGRDFRDPFVQSYESYVKMIISKAVPDADMLTEADEKRLGWEGKKNDVTVIYGDEALLIECKLSGIYLEAKRTASPESVIADVRKQIADVKERRGLFQLHDKIQSIRSGALPKILQDKYKNISRFYPVLLLFDDIMFANKAEVLGNIIQDELCSNGAGGFEYQIWHLEELEWLTKYAGAETMNWIAEKFLPKNRAIDLSIFVADKSATGSLKSTFYIPAGDTTAIRTLKYLIANEKDVQPV